MGRVGEDLDIARVTARPTFLEEGRANCNIPSGRVIIPARNNEQETCRKRKRKKTLTEKGRCVTRGRLRGEPGEGRGREHWG